MIRRWPDPFLGVRWVGTALMRQAMQASGARSKRGDVELGLRTLVRLKQQGEIRFFRGMGRWPYRYSSPWRRC